VWVRRVRRRAVSAPLALRGALFVLVRIPLTADPARDRPVAVYRSRKQTGGLMVYRLSCVASLMTLLIGFPGGSEAQTLSRGQSGPLAEVPFILYQNGIILSAVINGRDTLRLLLDTGWGPLALVRASAERLGLRLDPQGYLGITWGLAFSSHSEMRSVGRTRG